MENIEAHSVTNHPDSAGVWMQEDMRSQELVPEDEPYVDLQVNCRRHSIITYVFYIADHQFILAAPLGSADRFFIGINKDFIIYYLLCLNPIIV